MSGGLGIATRKAETCVVVQRGSATAWCCKAAPPPCPPYCANQGAMLASLSKCLCIRGGCLHEPFMSCDLPDTAGSGYSRGISTFTTALRPLSTATCARRAA